MLHILYLIPKNALSRLVGWLVSREQPAALARLGVRVFVWFFKIDLSEANEPLESYSCIAKLFTRKLKPTARPVEAKIVTPVDGVLRTCGQINVGKLLQVKGVNYAVSDLLGDAEKADKFVHGIAANFYLTPKDYHHVHAPIKGKILSVTHIPGKLWPVNDWSLNNIKNLFCINERVVVYLATDIGLCAIVLVGATNVGKISLSFDQLLTNQLGGSDNPRHIHYSQNLEVDAGQLVGTFHMGSSVILLFEKCELTSNILDSTRVRYGQKLFQNS